MTAASTSSPDLTLDEALRLASWMSRFEPGPTHVGSMRIIRSLVKAVQAMRLDETQRIVVGTLAWDKNANETWPETCQLLQGWVERMEGL